MPTRVHLRDDVGTSVVEVSGETVRFPAIDSTATVRRDADGRFVVDLGGQTFAAVAASQGDVVWVFVDGATFEIHTGVTANRDSTSDAGLLSPPMPATVVRVAVKVGQTVARGDLLIALEAMKMELPIRAAADGVVRAVHCREGELVQPGTRLLEI